FPSSRLFRSVWPLSIECRWAISWSGVAGCSGKLPVVMFRKQPYLPRAIMTATAEGAGRYRMHRKTSGLPRGGFAMYGPHARGHALANVHPVARVEPTRRAHRVRGHIGRH